MSKNKNFENAESVGDFENLHIPEAEPVFDNTNFAPDGSERNTPRSFGFEDRLKLFGGYQTINSDIRAYNDKVKDIFAGLLHNRKETLHRDLPGFTIHNVAVEAVPGAMFYHFNTNDNYAMGYLVVPVNVSSIPEGYETTPFMIEKTTLIKEELSSKLGKAVDIVNSIMIFEKDLTEMGAEKLANRIWMSLTAEWELQCSSECRMTVRELMRNAQWRVTRSTDLAIARYMQDSPTSLLPPCDFGFVIERAVTNQRGMHHQYAPYMPQPSLIWQPVVTVLCQVKLLGPIPTNQNKWAPVVKITGISCSMIEDPIFIFMGLAAAYDQVQSRAWTEPLLRPKDKGAINLGVIIPQTDHKLIKLADEAEAQEVISKWIIPTADNMGFFGPQMGHVPQVPIVMDMVAGYYRSSFLRYLSRPELMARSVDLARMTINPHSAPFNLPSLFRPYEKELVGTIGDSRAYTDSRNVTYISWASQNGAMSPNQMNALNMPADASNSNRLRAQAIQELTHSFRILTTNSSYVLCAGVGEWLLNMFNSAGFAVSCPSYQHNDPTAALFGGQQATRFGGMGSGVGGFTTDI